MTRIFVTAGTKKEIEFLEANGELHNAELYKCDRGSRKFLIGDVCKLVGLEEYPDLNGETVTITAYRESEDDLNGYYIRSKSGNVEPCLNFVWEKRLEKIDEAKRS